MAIGLARMFGFKFPENFNYPYNATGFTDFWRKWHISFGRWMKDYLYIALGGNESRKLKEYRNLWIIFLFSGLWHGASWTFVLWGMFHGTFMTIERITKGSLIIRALSEKIPTLIKISVTFILIAFSWVLFRSKNLDHSLDFYNALLTGRAASTTKVLGYLTSPYELWMIVIAAILSFFGPRLVPLFKLDSDRFSYIQFITAFTLFILSVTALAGRDFSPFIYFQF
jgi:alginate O-acetyltransferase complex protein AlgI